jgi:PKD repeat protein
MINNTKYCNTTGNPGTISSTGEYITIRFVSDQLLNYSGYKISFHSIEGKIPEPEFSVNAETSCNGFITFTDESANIPKSWSWDFGDGNTSTLKNPTHQYAINGTYSVTLTVSNQCGENTITKENLLVVDMPEPPEIDDIEACNNVNFDIELDLAGTAYWYENISSNKTVHIGNSWKQHVPITVEKIYFVREVFETTEKNVGDNCASYFTEVRLLPNPCSSIAQNQFDDIVITLNPTSGELRISNYELGITNVEIFDMMGRMVSDPQFLIPNSQFVIELNVSHFQAGIYFVRILTDKGIATKKIVKK